MSALTLTAISGAAIAPWLPRMAELRITVFREYPYLYDGSLAYEERYLGTYVRAPRSIAVLALDGEKLVGVSTGLPMEDETPEFQEPFVRLGYDPAQLFYGAESVLLKAYRGRGVYKEFFKQREAHAAALSGMQWSCFCAVERAPSQQPEGYRPLDEVWTTFGYAKQPHITTHYKWKDIDEDEESDHLMVYWMKRLKGMGS